MGQCRGGRGERCPRRPRHRTSGAASLPSSSGGCGRVFLARLHRPFRGWGGGTVLRLVPKSTGALSSDLSRVILGAGGPVPNGTAGALPMASPTTMCWGDANHILVLFCIFLSLFSSRQSLILLEDGCNRRKKNPTFWTCDFFEVSAKAWRFPLPPPNVLYVGFDFWRSNFFIFFRVEFLANKFHVLESLLFSIFENFESFVSTRPSKMQQKTGFALLFGIHPFPHQCNKILLESRFVAFFDT